MMSFSARFVRTAKVTAKVIAENVPVTQQQGNINPQNGLS